MTSRQSDNGNALSKLELRRHFLRRYHTGAAPLVFDAFQGSGLLWRQLRSEFDARYWGVDVKPKPGRLKIDSLRVLNQPGWIYDVVDLDAYWNPWKHWKAVLDFASQSVTVFLTIGIKGAFPAAYAEAVECLGLGKLTPRVPQSIKARLSQRAVPQVLAQAFTRFDVLEAAEAPPSAGARYIGIRLNLRA